MRKKKVGRVQLKKNSKIKKTTSLTDALNDAPLSIYHLRAFITAGMGFFTDAYDLFIIGTVMTVIKEQWHLSAAQVGLLGSSTLIATLLGSFVFGRIADILGRKAVYGLEAAIMAFGAIASAFAPNFFWLIVFRVILGLGIGGDYPVSGVIMSEYSNRANRGQLVSLVFSMQAVGLLIGPIVALTLLASGMDHNLAWRLMLGLGALPALGVIYLRRTLPESPRFLAQVHGKVELAARNIQKYSNGIVSVTAKTGPKIHRSFHAFIKNRRNLVLLFGTASTWFLLDYAYYGNTISTPLILKSVAPEANLLQATAWSLIIFAIAAAPGYVAAFLTIDRIGHKKLQWVGFLMMGICFATIGLFPIITANILPFLILYGLSYFFTEFGPNVTTFVIPTEVYSVANRTTGHGIAAGVGKLGAFIGVFAFPFLTAHLGLGGTLLLSSGCAFAGALVTGILPEAANKNLEDLNSEFQLSEEIAPAYSKAS